jgi:hypothetical protein
MFPPLKDNTLYEDLNGGFSNGAGDSLFAGNTVGNLTRRAVLAFDVASQIPPGSIVNSASLVLTVTRSVVAPATAVTVHPLLADWGEGASNAVANEGAGIAPEAGDATWIHTFFPDQFWAAEGGDFDPLPSATAAVGGLGAVTWTSPELAADVQAWLEAPGSNFGWVLLGDEANVGTAKRFASRENPDPGLRPVLAVDYTPPGGVNLSLGLNQTSFTTGETASLSVLASSTGQAGAADVFLGVLLPDGVTLLYFSDLTPNVAFGRFDALGALTPMIASQSLDSFNLSRADFFSRTWLGGEPPGTYTIYFVLTQPGALADGVPNPGDLLGARTASFTFAP